MSAHRERTRALQKNGGQGAIVGFAFPFLIGLTIFQLLPLVLALSDSFSAFNPITHANKGFVGASNYLAVFSDASFWLSIGNTFIYLIGICVVCVPLSYLLASMLNTSLPTVPFARAALIAALAASDAIMSLIWLQIYSTDNGIANALLEAIGLPGVGWLDDPVWARAGIVILAVWKNVGLPTLVFLAGMQSLDDSVLEAAQLDGAGRMTRAIRIVLPMMKGTIFVAVFMTMLDAAKLFSPILLMTGGGPQYATANIFFYAYDRGFLRLDYGTSSAATVIAMILLCLLLVIVRLLTRERDSVQRGASA